MRRLDHTRQQASERRRISRRLLLQGGTLSGIAASLSLVIRHLLSFASAPDDSTIIDASLRELFADPQAARLVGARYLGGHGDEASPARLRALLFAGAPPSSAISFAGWMAERRSVELSSEDVVVVAGWLLARSEGRLCALMSLLPAHA
jgi:hypothetical protein